jgi:hypothetical protein
VPGKCLRFLENAGAFEVEFLSIPFGGTVASEIPKAPRGLAVSERSLVLNAKVEDPGRAEGVGV